MTGRRPPPVEEEDPVDTRVVVPPRLVPVGGARPVEGERVEDHLLEGFADPGVVSVLAEIGAGGHGLEVHGFADYVGVVVCHLVGDRLGEEVHGVFGL